MYLPNQNQMKKILLIALALIVSNFCLAQKSELKMNVDYASENPEIADILQFEGINYIKTKFSGTDLKGKSYHLTVKEIWDGKVVRDTTVFDSKTMQYERFRKINDTVFTLKTISKREGKKLRMTFKFPGFNFTKVYDAIESDDYSLRNIADESKMEIAYNKKFYLLAYILPYEHKDGSKSWCEVGSNGKDLENWGKKFGIKHYLLFEMKFE